MALRTVLLMIPGFVIGMTVHEAAHAITSRWLGDNLAGKQGRITLNPLKHLSPLGTLMLFIAGFGWGNPVPVNLYNYKNPKRDYLLCSLAGPVSNILIASISLGLMYGLNWMVPVIEDPDSWMSNAYYYGHMILRMSMFINIVLAVINLVPIPPLDGSKIWPCMIPGMRPTHSSKTMWMWVIVLIIMLKTGATGKILYPVIDRVSSLAPKLAAVEQKRLGDFPAEVYAPPAAEVIEYDSWTEENTGKHYFIRFIWQEPHPSMQLVDWIQRYTEKHGWASVNNDTSAKWVGVKDESGKQLSWECEWTRPDGNMLQIELYRYFDLEENTFSGWIYGDISYSSNE